MRAELCTLQLTGIYSSAIWAKIGTLQKNNNIKKKKIANRLLNHFGHYAGKRS